MVTRSVLLVLSFTLATQRPEAQQRVWTVEDLPSSGVVWNVLLESNGTVRSQAKIGHVSSGIAATAGASSSSYFGQSACPVGDWNLDGVPDLVVGVTSALNVLCLNSDGTLQSSLPIAPIPPGLIGGFYGYSLCAVGDLDQNGVVDLAAGTPSVSAVRYLSGSVVLTLLNADATPKGFIVITEGKANFTGFLHPYDGFGVSVCAPGDLDGDSVPDLIVGANGGGKRAGTIWFLYLDPKNVVKTYTRTQASHPVFGGQGARTTDNFGSAICMLDDLDGDGIRDIAVGAPQADGGLQNGSGAVWILFMNADESVKAARKIGASDVPLSAGDFFGSSLSLLGDLDGDGLGELAVGARNDHETLQPRGAVWILHLNGDGSVRSHEKINARQGGFGGFLSNYGNFGRCLATPGDLDGDGLLDLTVGAFDSSDGAAEFGDLSEAVEDVPDGHTLLVKEGSYSPFQIDGKSLTIQGDSGADVKASAGSIRNLAASDAVFVRGLRSNFDLSDNSGLVWIEDCRVDPYCGSAVSVENSGQVVLLDVTLQGGCNFSTRDPAVSVIRSSLHAFDCSFLLEHRPSCFSPRAGSGIDADSSFVYLSHCSVRGGAGASSCCTSGGFGLDLDGEAWILDSSIAGGPDGCSGQNAPRFLLSSSASLNRVSGRALSMTSNSPVRENETLELSFQGPAHVPVWIASSLTPTASFRPIPSATRVVKQPLTAFFAGVTDGTGALSVKAALPPPPSSGEPRNLFFQAAYPVLHGQSRQRGGKLAFLSRARWVLGSGSAVVQLPSGF